MTLFLDTSAILAACGSQSGASHFVITRARENEWRLLASPYVIAEVETNLPGLDASFSAGWDDLRDHFELVPDVLTLPLPVIFAAAKDKPILFTAYSAADILLVLDQGDFAGVIADGFYGLEIMSPGNFLRVTRASGHLKE